MKHLQGKDFRRAFRAIAALRGRRDPALAQAIAREPRGLLWFSW